MGGKTSAASHNKWRDKTYQRIETFVPIGEKELIQAHAKAQNESTNAFINRAIKEAMERDNMK